MKAFFILIILFLYSCKQEIVISEMQRLDKLRKTCEDSFNGFCPNLSVTSSESFKGNVKGKSVCLYVGSNGLKSYFSSPDIISSNIDSVLTSSNTVPYNVIGIGIWGPDSRYAFMINSPHLPANVTKRKYLNNYLTPGTKLLINSKEKNTINKYSVSFGFYCDDKVRNGTEVNNQIILTSGYLMYGSWAGDQSKDSYLLVKNITQLSNNVYKIDFEIKCQLYSEMDHHYFGDIENGKFSTIITL